jgi:ABC-type transport system involved in multi-copper enzyme maturation permease subunit
MGLSRAEWLRFRKRPSIVVIAIGVPLLAGVFFVAGYGSISEGPPPLDEAGYRQELVDQGFTVGLPPEEAEAMLDQAVESERASAEMQLVQLELQRSKYAVPQSLVTMLGFGGIALVALILLTATSIGDEFSWGTIRTTLLASSNRPRLLAVRLAAITIIGLGMVVGFLALGLVLPLLLALGGATLESGVPVDLTGLGVLVVGTLVAALAAIAFAAIATLAVRSGALTLVAALVWLVAEASILSVLIRFEPFQPEGDLAWLLDAFPIHGLTTLSQTAAQVAGGLPGFPGEPLSTDLSPVTVPVIALAAWAVLFAALAFRRFSRMDIVE